MERPVARKPASKLAIRARLRTNMCATRATDGEEARRPHETQRPWHQFPPKSQLRAPSAGRISERPSGGPLPGHPPIDLRAPKGVDPEIVPDIAGRATCTRIGRLCLVSPLADVGVLSGAARGEPPRRAQEEANRRKKPGPAVPGREEPSPDGRAAGPRGERGGMELGVRSTFCLGAPGRGVACTRTTWRDRWRSRGQLFVRWATGLRRVTATHAWEPPEAQLRQVPVRGG